VFRACVFRACVFRACVFRACVFRACVFRACVPGCPAQHGASPGRPAGHDDHAAKNFCAWRTPSASASTSSAVL